MAIEIDTSWNILPITQVCSEENIHLRLDCRGEFGGLASKGCSPSKWRVDLSLDRNPKVSKLSDVPPKLYQSDFLCRIMSDYVRSTFPNDPNILQGRVSAWYAADAQCHAHASES